MANRPNNRSIKYGDPRLFFESTITKTFNSPAGIVYEPGSVVRGSTFINFDNLKNVSLSLPSMAELIFHQSKINMGKAASIRRRACKTSTTNGVNYLVDEELFYTYMQLFSMGLLGLYSALETMVYELYILRHKDKKLVFDGKELSYKEFTSKGFQTKITAIAAQLSGKDNIYGSDLHKFALEIHKLRTLIQHWNLEYRNDYFINLPENHPLRVFPNSDPLRLSTNARSILDHYSLKPKE